MDVGVEQWLQLLTDIESCPRGKRFTDTVIRVATRDELEQALHGKPPDVIRDRYFRAGFYKEAMAQSGWSDYSQEVFDDFYFDHTCIDR